MVVTVGEALLEAGNFEISDYNWGLWITQLPCDGSRLLTAPTGCFQYYLESSGSLKSYNFQGGQYLNNQVIQFIIFFCFVIIYLQKSLKLMVIENEL